MLIQGGQELVLGVSFLVYDLLVDGSEEGIVISQLFDGNLEAFFFVLEEDEFGAIICIEVPFDFFLENIICFLGVHGLNIILRASKKIII